MLQGKAVFLVADFQLFKLYQALRMEANWWFFCKRSISSPRGGRVLEVQDIDAEGVALLGVAPVHPNDQ